MASGNEFSPLTQHADTDTLSASGDEKRIPVPLDQIIPWLAEAAANGLTWLQDFEEEEICISADLYDVILAYRHFHEG